MQIVLTPGLTPLVQVAAAEDGSLYLITMQTLTDEIRRMILEKVSDAFCGSMSELSNERCRSTMGN